ncbi:hypothetical protein GOP47_0030632 [Adiantum capillus-veneris]|nr:hypothetical protein GOP47_0030632 [Adiantum capillus-veneris]
MEKSPGWPRCKRLRAHELQGEKSAETRLRRVLEKGDGTIRRRGHSWVACYREEGGASATWG